MRPCRQIPKGSQGCATSVGPRPWQRLRLVALVLLAPIALTLLIPLPPDLASGRPSYLEITDRHGQRLRQLPRGADGYRRHVPLAAIPPNLIQATLAAEDRRFWWHPGIDPLAIVRALRDNLRHARVTSGASTITQQLIKLSRPRAPRTLPRKALEAIQAIKLDLVWGKGRILETYLNRADYGHLCTGVATAADYYLGKPLADLSLAECAFLAGLPQGPARLDPYRHYHRACLRKLAVVKCMRRNGWISSEEFGLACADDPVLQSPRRDFEAPHFVDLVLSEDQRPAPGGVLRTTLDLTLNRQIEHIISERLSALRNRNANNAAAVVIDNATGEVLALVGSEDYFAPGSGQVNGAVAPRSTGSALKPFTYAIAFERGLHPATVLPDVPSGFPTPTGVFEPVNYDRRCFGPVLCRAALACSLNIPAVRILHQIGGPDVLHERLRHLGVTTLTQPPSHYGLGLTIGNAEACLLELANAYACLARLGTYLPWRILMVESPAGAKPSDDGAPAGARLFDPRIAYLIADILADNDARAPAFGFQSPLRFPFPVACKTGTSSDYRDNWAFAYTPDFTVGVWVGNFDGSPMRDVSGVSGSAPILNDIVTRLAGAREPSWYEAPEGVITRPVHPITGHAREPDAQGAVTEKFLSGTPPDPESHDDYDPGGRIRLGPEYASWWRSGDNWLRDRTVLDDGLADGPVIEFPPPDASFRIDPDLPHNGTRLPLRCHGTLQPRWSSPTLPIEPTADVPVAHLAEGRHQIRLTDAATGQSTSLWIHVRRL